MARIVILGGNGKIARLLAPLLVADGDEVVSVIRNPDQREAVAETGATPHIADLEELSTDEISELFVGFDAIVWSAGAGGGNPTRTYAVDRDAAIRTMEAAQHAGVARYVMVSYFGASTQHGLDPENSFYAYAEAKARADEHLSKSGLSWTILGPSSLTLEPASGTIDTEASESGNVSRANVALVIRTVLRNDASVRKTIRFNDGSTRVEDAIGAA
ncbi:MAG: SDR family oxidoreductase [Leucobacter sp.]